MTRRKLTYAALALAAVSTSGMADARSQMRAVGSSTVYPFAKMVAERIARANPRLGTPIIESTGTGAGMKLFCAGVGERFPDVENASRRMKASEAKQCAQNGVTAITEIQVGIDGISLATAKNTPLQNVTTRDIYMALAKTPYGKPNRAKTWHDVNAKLPNLAINGVGPSYQTISSFKYPGARPLYIYIKNAHAGAIPAVRAYAAEFTKESAFGPNGYLLKAGLISAPNSIRAHSQQAARALAPLNLASLK